MSALSRVIRAGVARRRWQTVVLVLTTTMAVTAAVLAAGLLVAAQAPFATAFAHQRGAQLTARFDATTVSGDQAGATAHLPVVTDAAGPFPVLTLRPRVGSAGAGLPAGDQLAPMTFVGRAERQGPVDDLRLTAGRWATGRDEVVLPAQNAPLDVGDTMAFPDLPGTPTLTVVGRAASITGSADAWVSPATLATLTGPGIRPAFQMLYRFHAAATTAEMNTDRAAINAAVPPGGLTAAASYLTTEQAADRNAATFVPFVTAFGVLALVMSVLTIGIVVGGAVSSATRRIGILKSVGFTPGQVVRAFVGQAMAPATAGTLLGTVLGNLLAIPVMGDVGTAFGTGTPMIDPWIDAAVPVLALTVVACAALAPALRAGRLRTVEAIAVGRTPRAGRGRQVRRLLGALPLPRTVSLGLAGPFARPGRSATMLAAVLLGTIGVTFGLGLVLSLNNIQDGLNRRSPGAVVVQLFGPPPPPAPGGTSTTKPATSTDLADVIAAQPGTRRYVTTGQTRVAVAGRAGQTDVIVYQGDTSWAGYQMIAGSWFDRPGQAVVPAAFLADTGTHLGDTITLTNNGNSARVTIVGEVFATHELILTDLRSLAGLNAEVLPESVEYDIDLRPGVDTSTYLDALDTALAPYGLTGQANSGKLSATALAIDALATLLTAMLVAVAGFGVLNTVALDIRERVRDFGIYQALGMSPRQTIAMVLTSVTGVGLLAGAIGAPLGMLLHDLVLPAMGRAAGTAIPQVDLAVYRPVVLIPLVLGGAVLAIIGALAPATWATRMRTATALRTE
ncbi:MAG TPA: FtsX-like permease family protein [Pseudonocardiaceae bacterium]